MLIRLLGVRTITCNGTLDLHGAVWALSRCDRNAEQHALHGNIRVTVSTLAGATLHFDYRHFDDPPLWRAVARLLAVPWESVRQVGGDRPFHLTPSTMALESWELTVACLPLTEVLVKLGARRLPP